MRTQLDNLLKDIVQFLPCKTPDQWLANALSNTSTLLIDHANCEKKAAGTALNLMYRYVDDFQLLNKMSRLAREEMRHFEQVIAIMEARGISYQNISASRYAGGLMKDVRTHEPAKLIDTMIVGALIEARSCERFAAIAPHLDDELQQFYFSLLRSEARHFKDYLQLASVAVRKHGDDEKDFTGRIAHFCEVEKDLILSPDQVFRFHSGPVAEKTATA